MNNPAEIIETKEFIKKKKGHTYIQWALAIIANITLLCNGLDSGWMSPMTKVLESDASPLGEPLSPNMLSWIASIISFTAALSVPLYSFIADKYGRKISAIAIAVPQLVAWAVRLSFATPTSLLISRALSGLAAGGCYNIIPIYVKEISQNDIRGTLGTLLVVGENVGILMMYIMGAYLDYYTILRIVAGIPALTLVLLIKAPESPQFMVKQNRIEEAIKTVAFLRGLDKNDESIKNEITEMKNEEDYFRSLPELSIMTIFRNRIWRKGILIVAAMYSMQPLNGAFSIIIYAASILEATGANTSVSSETLSLAIPSVMILGSLIAMVVMDRVGRKVLNAIMFSISAVSLLCIATSLLIGSSVPSWLPVSSVVMTVGAYSGGVVPLPVVVMMEVFNFQIRAKVSGLVISYSLVLSFLQIFIYVPLSSAFGMYTAFFFFAAINGIGILFALLIQPETRGKSVEEIEEQLGRGGGGKELIAIKEVNP